MMRQLVLIHGRAQEHKDAAALKVEWLEALADGLAKSGLELPIPEANVHFPFYGDTLYDLVKGESPDEAAEVILRGEDTSDEEKQFTRAFIEEVRQKAKITAAQIAAAAGQEVIERGPLEWGWSRAVLRAIDRHVPHGSGTSIALITHDVYRYLNESSIRDTIDDGVSAALTPGVETVVVSHSLGTVVAYNILRQRGGPLGWKVPLFVTVGSPLGVTAIRKSVRKLASPTRCPECASQWFNAMDERDVVALYPLGPNEFPIDPPEPAIDNKRDVRNKTKNRHGIAGYLDDQEVARRIYDALIA